MREHRIAPVIDSDVLLPPADTRRRLLDQAVASIEDYHARLEGLPVTPAVDAETVRNHLARFDFQSPIAAEQVLQSVTEKLEDWAVHTTHPRYFGLFNPSPSFQGVLADLLVAAYNPQVGAWHHHPFGVEVEAHLVRFFAARFGLPETAFGHFTSGGSEANFTAVLMALTRQFPSFARQGLRGLDHQPVLYCSTEFHHSFEKIAHHCGLGRDAVRLVPVTDRYVMDTTALGKAIHDDRRRGLAPFLVNATAGTTNAGLIEPIEAIAEVTRSESLHLHVDAAWGGSVILSDRHRHRLAGIELADTITFDPHKLLSVPMGAGMVLCRDRSWLNQTFGLHTDYVPRSATEGLDAYQHTLQFSRRFIGLKLFMTLATIGQAGYSNIIDHQLAMAVRLAELLSAEDFEIRNGASLGVVCFVPPASWSVTRHEQFESLAARVRDSGKAWMSATRLGGHSVLRACITSHLTRESHLQDLVAVILASRD